MNRVIEQYNALVQAMQEGRDCKSICQDLGIAIAQELNSVIADMYGIYDNNGFYYLKEDMD